jgi:flagellar protein FlbT
MQLVLSGDKTPEDAHLPLLRQIEELSQVFTDADSRNVLADATRGLVEGQHYRALKALRALLPREDRLLAARPH